MLLLWQNAYSSILNSVELRIYWDILNVTFCYEVLIHVQTMEQANNIVFYFLERSIEVKLYFELDTKTCWENVFIFKLNITSCPLVTYSATTVTLVTQTKFTNHKAERKQ